MALVPGVQGGVVAQRHTSMDAESTPVPIIDSSSSDTMSTGCRASPEIRVTNQQLNQQVNVAHVVSVDPRLVAEAKDEIARAHLETQRVTLLAETTVNQTRSEAQQFVGQAVRDAESKVYEAQSQASQASRDAESRVTDIQNRASSAVNQIQSHSQGLLAMAQSKIQQLESALSQTQEENHRFRLALKESDERHREQTIALQILQAEFENQTRLMRDKVQSLENRLSRETHMRPSNPDQVQNSAVDLRLPIASGSNAQCHRSGSEMLQRTGDQSEVKAPLGSRLLQYSSDDFVHQIFGEENQRSIPVHAIHTPREDPNVASRLNELTSKLDSLASVVHGFMTGQGPNRIPNRIPKPPSSPDRSSSSSNRSADDKRPDPKGSPGGGGGSPPSSMGPRGSPKASSSRSESQDPYEIEKKLMRIKSYDTIKVPSLPKSAAEARSFRNAVFNTVCKMAKGDEAPVFAWIMECMKPNVDLSDSLPYPVLDRVLGSKLLELSKSTRFAMHFQTVQEEAQRVGRQPKGRKLLWIIFEKYKMEKDKGVALTQSHLLNLKVSGNDIKALEDFRNKFDFIWQALETAERPSESAVRSLLFEQLKSHPKLQLTIDKFRNASSSSSKRTSAWLYEKLVEVIEIHQLEENSANIEKSLANIGNQNQQKTDAHGNAAKPQKPQKNEKSAKQNEQEKPDKPSKSEKPSKADKPDKPEKEKPKDGVNAAAAKGKGKGKDEKTDKKTQDKKSEELKKQPCMYFGYNACSKGDKCPYLHDPANKYSGPKPKGLKDKAGSSSAGAATVIAATSLATRIKPSSAEAETVSSSNAPQDQTSDKGEFLVSGIKGAMHKIKKSCKRFSKTRTSGLPRAGMFEKAIKLFSAMVAVANPIQQEFLLDTGAGRNLISYKSMPDMFKEHVQDAPEKIHFATGGGVRPRAKSLVLEGSQSGTNTFYALKDCPHALSVGIQVEEHRRPFVWFPGQLPYLIKADRIEDVVHHVPESARIYADRVVENVPIMSESVCVAMPATTGGSSGSKDPIAREVPRPLLPDPPDPSSGTSASPKKPAHPSDLPRSGEPLRLVEKPLPRFGVDVEELLSTEVIREKGDEPIDSDDEESNPWVPSLREKLQIEAKSAKHALTHFPKNRYCEICRRSKMTAKLHRKRGLEVDPEENPPLHYGHRIRVDHIVLGRDLAKGSEGEQACLVCLDEYSGCLAAYPQTSRATDQNIQALQKFGGTKAHGKALCIAKSDTARELTDAISFLGWLPDPSVPNDEVHNAKLERAIRSIKEGVRAIMLKSGLPHEFWPRAIEYFCVAQSFSNAAPIHPNDSEEVANRKNTETCYEAATGELFSGLRLPFGCLVYYKPPKHRELPAFEPRTYPGIFVGWRMDANYKHRGVHYVLDYEGLRTNSKGCGRPIQVYQSELVDPTNGNWVFPLFEAQVAKLQLFSERTSLPALESRDALPFEGEAPKAPARKRRTYVTLDRAIKYGKTPGCRGCEKIAEGIPHNDVCHERFRICLEEERLAAEARAARTPSSPPVPGTPRVSAPETLAVGAQVQCCPSCSNAPDTSAFAAPFVECHQDDKESDHWLFDKGRGAWQRVHVRPRKRLFAPTGKDCPFDASDVFTERVTEWKCRNKVSLHKDDWQKTPYQRISSKSWVGSTWFYPRKPIDEDKAKLFAMQANIANGSEARLPKKCDAMFATMIAESQDKFATAEHIERVIRNVHKVKPPKERKHRSLNPTCFEFCCSKDSSLGEVNESRGINHFRLSSQNTDMSDDVEVDSLIQILNMFPGADIFGSIPCGPWSAWQRLNKKQYGPKFIKKINKQRKVSMRILKNYIRCAEVVLKNGGRCAFEWPKDCEGWQIPELMQFCKRHDLFVAEPQGCAFGVSDSKGNPHLKSWWVATSSWKLATNLDNKRCSHSSDFKHAPLEGGAARKSAFYTKEMAECISNSLYDHIVPAMPVKQLVNEMHCQGGIGPFAAVHLLLNRNEWHKHEGWEAAIKKEVDGLLANKVWSFDEVVSRDDLLERTKKDKASVNIGRLMTILSIKNFESPSLRKLKARIVFRGDDIRTEDNTLAVLQEAKVNPTGLVGLNINLAYGCCKGNSSTQSDVVRAYTQSYLQTVVPTWVELPGELVPPEHAHIRRPCVKLVKALYGHPEAGWHWNNRFCEVMKLMQGTHLPNFQSSYWFPHRSLLLTLYVDDMVLSGPSSEHQSFWSELSRHLEFEEPTSVDRILGRKQQSYEDDSGSYVSMSMEDFLESSCTTYEELTKSKIKEASTPYMPEGSLNTTDWEIRGALADSASRILMKILWAARLCRPDLMKSIGDLTKRLTTWSIADDKRLHRLMGYIKGSTQSRLVGKVGDSMDSLKLCLYTDADHCSGIDHTKSTSGMIMALEGPHSWFPLAWASRRQTATARSTTEAEMLSLGAGLFGEGIPAQELLEEIFQRPVVLECLQDNSAVISIVSAGYSPKLRHLSKTQKIELGSIYEVFEESGTVLLYIKTDKQRADPLTKNLQPASWSEALKLLGITPKSMQ